MSVERRDDDGLQGTGGCACAMIMFMISPEATPLVRKTYVEPWRSSRADEVIE
jgi:hypothetical protein